MFRGWCGHPDVCYLGYDLTYLVGEFGISSGYPGEPCPKPRTYMAMCDAPRKSFSTLKTSANNGSDD